MSSEPHSNNLTIDNNEKTSQSTTSDKWAKCARCGGVGHSVTTCPEIKHSRTTSKSKDDNPCCQSCVQCTLPPICNCMKKCAATCGCQDYRAKCAGYSCMAFLLGFIFLIVAPAVIETRGEYVRYSTKESCDVYQVQIDDCWYDCLDTGFDTCPGEEITYYARVGSKCGDAAIENTLDQSTCQTYLDSNIREVGDNECWVLNCDEFTFKDQTNHVYVWWIVLALSIMLCLVCPVIFCISYFSDEDVCHYRRTMLKIKYEIEV